MRFDGTTDASPGQVLQTLTDFTERRPRIWHRTLDPKTYELRELGDTGSLAFVSTAASPFQVVKRYDWSDPSLVRCADVETSWFALGSGEVRPRQVGQPASAVRLVSGDHAGLPPVELTPCL